MDFPHEQNDPEYQRMLAAAKNDPTIKEQALGIINTQQNMLRYYLGLFEETERKVTGSAPTEDQEMMLRALTLPRFVPVRDFLVTKEVLRIIAAMIGDLENAKKELR